MPGLFPSTTGQCRSSEALLTKQAAALVKGVDLAAGLCNQLHLLLDLHAAASVAMTQQALALFVNSICLAKVGLPSPLKDKKGSALLRRVYLLCLKGKKGGIMPFSIAFGVNPKLGGTNLPCGCSAA